MDEKDLGAMTPDQIQALEQTEQPKTEPEAPKEEPKEPVKEPEAPQKKETPEEPKEPEAKKEEPKKEEEPPVLPKKNRPLSELYVEKKKETRDLKVQLEQTAKERDELALRIEALEGAKTPKEKEEAQTDLDSFAEEIGIEPMQLKKMREIFLKDVKSDVSKEDVEFVKGFRAEQEKAKAEQEKRDAENNFKEEWNAFVPSLEKEFPQSDKNFTELQKEIHKLAHSPLYADKEMDYILWKNKEYLSKFVSAKKGSFESGNISHESQKETPKEVTGSMTPEQLQNSMGKPPGSSLEIRSSNK